MASPYIKLHGANIYDPNATVSVEGSAGIQFQSTGSVLLQGRNGFTQAYYGAVATNNEVAVVGDVSVETSRAKSAELSLSQLGSSAVSAEASRAISAEGSLTSRVGSEETRAASAEASLTSGVSAEASRATSAEGSLTSRVGSEETRAASAEASLTSGVSAEASRANSAELSLSQLGSSAVSAEASRAISAEGSLTSRVGSEETRAASAEASLTSGVSAEASRATSAELGLGVGISAEVSRVSNAFSGGAGITALTVSNEVAANAFVTTSDARLKKDVVEVSNALDVVQQIRPVFYNWVDGRESINPGHQELGFLAQELEAVLPNVVHTLPNMDGRLEDQKTVAYDRLVSLLVCAVKELNAKVNALSK